MLDVQPFFSALLPRFSRLHHPALHAPVVNSAKTAPGCVTTAPQTGFLWFDMVCKMFLLRLAKDKVFNAIVVSFPVYMVNGLMRKKVTPKFLFHHQPMLKHVTIRHSIGMAQHTHPNVPTSMPNRTLVKRMRWAEGCKSFSMAFQASFYVCSLGASGFFPAINAVLARLGSWSPFHCSTSWHIVPLRAT